MLRLKRIPGFFLLATLAACSDVTVTGGGPTTLSLTADRTSAVTNEDVTFLYDAAGTSLIRVVLAYGDGTADTVDAFGAVTASGQRSHAYAVSGTYQVEGTAEDAVGGAAADTVTVRIDPSNPGF